MSALPCLVVRASSADHQASSSWSAPLHGGHGAWQGAGAGSSLSSGQQTPSPQHAWVEAPHRKHLRVQSARRRRRWCRGVLAMCLGAWHLLSTVLAAPRLSTLVARLIRSPEARCAQWRAGQRPRPPWRPLRGGDTVALAEGCMASRLQGACRSTPPTLTLECPRTCFVGFLSKSFRLS